MKSNGWKELYPSVRLRPGSGFEFVELQYAATADDYLSLLKTIGVSAEEIAKEKLALEPTTGVKSFQMTAWIGGGNPLASPDKVYPLLRYYLSENATSTFAIAQRNGWDGGVTSAKFYIAFREPKDTFLFLLKFPKARRVRLIQRDMSYYVRVATDDNTDITKSIELLDESQKTHWNKEDPQGLL